jgi:hypothetical protein
LLALGGDFFCLGVVITLRSHLETREKREKSGEYAPLRLA